VIKSNYQMYFWENFLHLAVHFIKKDREIMKWWMLSCQSFRSRKAGER
jgi:hypothetical protein